MKKQNIFTAFVFIGVLVVLGAPAPARAAIDCCQTQIQLLQQILEAVHRVNIGNIQSNKELDETLARQADAFSNALKKEMNEKAYTDAMTRDYRDPTRYSCAVGTMARGEPVPNGVDPELVQVLMNVNKGEDANTPVQAAKMINISCNLGVLGDRLGSELRCPTNAEYLNGDTSLDIGVFKNKCIQYDPDGLRSAMQSLARPNSPLSPSSPHYRAALATHAVQVNIGLYDRFPAGKEMLSQASIMSTGDYFSGVSRLNAGNSGVLQALAYNTCKRRDLQPGCERGQQQREQIIREQFPNFRDFPTSSNFCHSPYIIDLAKLADIKKRLQQAPAAGQSVQHEILVTQLRQLYVTIEDNMRRVEQEAALAAATRSVNDPALGAVNKPIQAKQMNELLGAIKELTAVIREQQQSLPSVRDASMKGYRVRGGKKPESKSVEEKESKLQEPEDALRTLGIKVSEKNILPNAASPVSSNAQ